MILSHLDFNDKPHPKIDLGEVALIEFEHRKMSRECVKSTTREERWRNLSLSYLV